MIGEMCLIWGTKLREFRIIELWEEILMRRWFWTQNFVAFTFYIIKDLFSYWSWEAFLDYEKTQ